MPSAVNESPEKGQPPIAAGATAGCVFPDELVLCILTRLPVKSILRFSSVCKPWRDLLSSPEFVKSHKSQFSRNPKNQTAILYEINTRNMSLLDTDSDEMKLNPIGGPYFENCSVESVDFVGCQNGLICLVFQFLSLEVDQVIVVWNPAMQLIKPQPLQRVFLPHTIVSLGFGYDAAGDDFKVVRIVCVAFEEEGELTEVSRVEVYSVSSDSRVVVEAGFRFSVFWTKTEVIVNGNPYWVAEVDEEKSDECHVLVCFDVGKLVFKIVPLPAFYLSEESGCKLVDVNGALGALVWNENGVTSKSLDVWLFDGIWRKRTSLGTVWFGVVRFLLCLKNGCVVGKRNDGELFVFDPVKEIAMRGSQKQFFELYEYTESLWQVRGMTKEDMGWRKWKVFDEGGASSDWCTCAG